MAKKLINVFIIIAMITLCALFVMSCENKDGEEAKNQTEVSNRTTKTEKSPHQEKNLAKTGNIIKEDPAKTEESIENTADKEQTIEPDKKKEEPLSKEEAPSKEEPNSKQKTKKDNKKTVKKAKKWIEPVYKTVSHPEEGHTEVRYYCKCGKDVGSVAGWKKHRADFIESNGGVCNGEHVNYSMEEEYIVDKAAWTEEVLVSEGHWE